MAVLSIPTLLSAANFLYPNVYQPSVAPYLLQLNLDFGKPTANTKGTMLAVPVTVRATNPAKMKVYVVGSTLAVTGRKTKPIKNGSVGAHMRDAVRNRAPVTRYAETVGYDLLLADELIGAGFYLEPGEEHTSTRIVQLPVKTSYETLRLEAEVLVIRGDRVIPELADETISWNDKGNRVESVPSWMKIPASVHFVHWKFSLKESNAIARYTRQPLDLNVWWVLQNPEIARPRGSYLASLISAQGQQDREPAAAIEERSSARYGLQSTGTLTHEASVWQLVKASQG